MHTKLTLRIEETLIKRAKDHAKQKGKSVSQMVADYFTLLDAESADDTDVGPLTRSLRGALRGKAVDEQDYRDYLEKKYQ